MRPDAPRARAQLAERLATYQSLAGLTARELGARLGVSFGQVSKLGRGEKLPDRALTIAWLDACNVTDEADRREVLALLADAHTSTRSWRAAMRQGGGEHLADDYLANARLVCCYQPARIPGLLQTPEYARFVLERLGAEGTDVEASVAGRMQRAEVLWDRTVGRRFRFVIGEHVLRRDYGRPSMMREQRARLRALDDLDAVEVVVLPDDELAPASPFWIYDEPVEGDPLVLVEVPHGQAHTAGPETVADYRADFTRLRHAARPL